MADGAETIADLIRRDMGRLTATERRAAHALLASYPVAGLETVADFARRANVSPPTILRFCARLGFASYPEFQKTLRDELDAQLKSPLAKTSFVPGTPFDPDHFLAGFRNGVLDNINETFRHIPPGEFDAVVDLLAAPKRQIGLIGGRFTDAIARYMGAHLRILRPDVFQFIGQFDNWRDQLLDFGRKDVLICFDVRRYQDDLLQIAERAVADGITIVLFTDQWLSPIAALARHVLPARIAVPSNWDSSVAVLALVEAMLAATTERLWSTAQDRLARLEKLRRHS